MFAFTPPSGSGSEAARMASVAATSEPDSIGSPSAVPVPCASLSVSSSGITADPTSAATSRPRCAWPLGAVRLADLPSCRTTLPCKLSSELSSRLWLGATPPTCLGSGVPAEVMPAIAKLRLGPGVSVSETPAAMLVMHSSSCSALIPT